MRPEIQNLDSLRREVRKLENEKVLLLKLLKENNIPVPDLEGVDEDSSESASGTEEDQGSRIFHPYITPDMARAFLSRFHGRFDVYAKRAKSGGYYPQCKNRWERNLCRKFQDPKFKCQECQFRQWTPVNQNVVSRHLFSVNPDETDVIGLYPLQKDGTCRFLVFDFDDHSSEPDEAEKNFKKLKEEVNSLRLICKKNEIPCFVERSRSGKGAHLWIFFKQDIPAAKARAFRQLLIDRGMKEINLTSFDFYDRMFPTQSTADGLGNLVALPLQGYALQSGNSAFVDEDWNAYPDQWQIVIKGKSLSEDEVDHSISSWTQELYGSCSHDLSGPVFCLRPWERDQRWSSSDVYGKLSITLADGIYVDKLNLSPAIQNQIRQLAIIRNPAFYKNQGLGYSNWNQKPWLYFGADQNGYIQLPRGLLPKIVNKCGQAGIEYEIENRKKRGKPLNVKFNGDLYPKQKAAFQALNQCENGILQAATGFGKTVIAARMIAEKKVSTLVIVNKASLADQWISELDKFLDFDEPLPEYQTPTGLKKKFKTHIGKWFGSRKQMGSLVDVAVDKSLLKAADDADFWDSYGMVIVDECHAAGSETYRTILDSCPAQYIYGLSATPKRSDGLDRLLPMYLGDIRHSYTSRERAEDIGLNLILVPRFTGFSTLTNASTSYAAAVEEVVKNDVRNQQIAADVKKLIKDGRNPVILSSRKEHLRTLLNLLSEAADHIFILSGDQSNSQNRKQIEEMKSIPDQESLLVLGTTSMIGEGFDFPRLDTLLLTTPFRFSTPQEQYVGRLNRTYPGKTSVMVYDYIDYLVPVFSSQYQSRLRYYKKLGYKPLKTSESEKQTAGSLFDIDSYLNTYERDLSEAEKRIVVASPSLTLEKVERFILLTRSRIQSGVKVTVILTEEPLNLFSDSSFTDFLISKLRQEGIEIRRSEDETSFALIDDDLVWHGGINLLGKEDNYSSIIRFHDPQALSELIHTVSKLPPAITDENPDH